LKIVLAATEDPFRKNKDIKHLISYDISENTIGNCLLENNLYSCVAPKKESLSAGHRAERLEFAHEYLNFDE
jgi:hypothetical protein